MTRTIRHAPSFKVTMPVRSLSSLAAMTLLLTMIGKAGAQANPQPAPPAIEVAMKARAEKFLRAVSSLSPMPTDTDAARAQTWPIPFASSMRILDRATGQMVDRWVKDAPVSVVAHQMWDDPARGPAWTVRGYRGEMTIRSDTRYVTSFIDTTMSGALEKDPAPDKAECISQDVAISRAYGYLCLTGVDTHELTLQQALLSDTSIPAVAITRTWTISWKRATNGVLYNDQGADVTLDAGKGRLYAYGAALSTPLPAVMRLDVSADQAVAIARRFLAGRSWNVLEEPAVALRIVMPSDFWEGVASGGIFRGMQPHRKSVSRLAWVVRTQTDWPAPNPLRWDVWVDASTGEVIGGEDLGGIPKGTFPPAAAASMRLLNTLSGARRLSLQMLDRGGVAALALDAVGAPLHFYGALGGMTAVTSEPTGKQVPTHRIEAMTRDGKIQTLNYDSTSGLLWAAEGGVVQAGSALRNLLAACPNIHYKAAVGR